MGKGVWGVAFTTPIKVLRAESTELDFEEKHSSRTKFFLRA